jgi:hypothetical protein
MTFSAIFQKRLGIYDFFNEINKIGTCIESQDLCQFDDFFEIIQPCFSPCMGSKSGVTIYTEI